MPGKMKKTQMISLHVGKLGVGKSANCTYEVLQHLLAGRDVAVNWPLDPTPYFQALIRSPIWKLKTAFNFYVRKKKPKFGRLFKYGFDSDGNLLPKDQILDEFCSLENMEIYFDESQTILNARDYMKIPLAFLLSITSSRHYHNNCHFITQDPGMVDVNIRRLINELIVYKRFGLFSYYHVYDGEAVHKWESANGLPPAGFTNFHFRWLSKKIFKCYNSFWKFKATEPFSKDPEWTIQKVLELEKPKIINSPVGVNRGSLGTAVNNPHS